MNNPDSAENTKKNICPWCGQFAVLIWVHGHGQCSNCGYNIDECCRGENCSDHDNDINNNENSN